MRVIRVAPDRPLEVTIRNTEPLGQIFIKQIITLTQFCEKAVKTTKSGTHVKIWIL